MSEAELAQAQALAARGQAAEALVITGRLAEAADASHGALAFHATLLKAMGRPEEALLVNLQAAKQFAASGVAWHNLASTLADMGRGAEAKAAVERAFAHGLDAPETWQVRGRALLALGDHDAAEQSYAEALNRAPQNADVAGELADLIWMRRGDLKQAQGLLDAVFHAGGPGEALLLAKARLFDAAGETTHAADLLAAGATQAPDDLPLLLAAAQAALVAERRDAALAFAERAEALAPANPRVLNELCIVLLAQGQGEAALAKARAGLAVAPDDQSLLGWAATAARAVGDPLHAHLFDYDGLVATYDIETPAGWANRAAYLADLAATLRPMHLYGQHPTNQSVRQGSQTQHSLMGSDAPALKAFFEALKAPMAAYLAKLGKGADPLRRRNTGRYRLKGAWSVLLRPGGFHNDHFHPEGWISSAFYVETPDQALRSRGREGWIRFGQPPFRTEPPMEAERYIKPQPGRLVLFPSYMWHGTVPFTTDEARLTLAFDAVPG